MAKAQVLSAITIAIIIISIFTVFGTISFASAVTTPSIDGTSGSNVWAFNTNPTTLTIKTSTTNEIIYATCYSKTSGKGLGISSTPSLTWHYRGGTNTTGTNGELAAWWAVSPTAQTITLTFTGSSTGGCVMQAFCVKDADITSPFDPNVSTAGTNSATSSTSASATITTTNANDLVIGVIGIINNKAITAGTGYTQINNTGTGNAVSGASEYAQTSSIGSQSPTFTIGASTSWVEVSDAFVPASTLSVLPENSFGGLIAFGICLAAMLLFYRRNKKN